MNELKHCHKIFIFEKIANHTVIKLKFSTSVFRTPEISMMEQYSTQQCILTKVIKIKEYQEHTGLDSILTPN